MGEYRGMTDDPRIDIGQKVREKLEPEVLSLEAFPDGTEAVLRAMTYEESSRLKKRGRMTRGDIADILPPEVDLDKDAVKYRLEKLLEQDLVFKRTKDHPEFRTPTHYYELSTDGEYILKTQVTVEGVFGRDPEEIEREDIYTLVDELQQTRARVDHLEQRLEDLEAELEDDEAESTFG
jgi:predicted ArsR family transcriptional regulator